MRQLTGNENMLGLQTVRLNQTRLDQTGWRLGVVVSVVGRINEVNQHRARLVHDG